MRVLHAIAKPFRALGSGIAQQARLVWRTVRRHPWAVLGMLLLAGVCAVVAIHRVEWVRHYLAAHGLSIMIGAGAVATALGVAAGGVLAGKYGRRASVSIEADVHPSERGVVISVRPTVKAVGVFPVKFLDDPDAVIIRVIDVAVGDSGQLLRGDIRPKRDVFKQQFVEAGEELSTTCVFPPFPVKPNVIGWTVSIVVSAKTRWLRRLLNVSGYWTDQVFIERPGTAESLPVLRDRAGRFTSLYRRIMGRGTVR